MVPPRAPSQCLKRKLDNVYPLESDTGDEVWNQSDEESDDDPSDVSSDNCQLNILSSNVRACKSFVNSKVI